MSEKLDLASLEGLRHATFLDAISEAQRVQRRTARLIDGEVNQILSEAHGRARELLIAHRPALEQLAKLLLEKEVVDRPALQAILKVRNIDSIKEKKRVSDAPGDQNHLPHIQKE